MRRLLTAALLVEQAVSSGPLDQQIWIRVIFLVASNVKELRAKMFAAFQIICLEILSNLRMSFYDVWAFVYKLGHFRKLNITFEIFQIDY